MTENKDPWISIPSGELSSQEVVELIETNLSVRRKTQGKVKIIVPTFGQEHRHVSPPADLTYSFTLFKHLRNLADLGSLEPYRPEPAKTFLSNLPLIGRWWANIQEEAHKLVLHYVNNLIRRQRLVNEELLYLIEELIGENIELRRTISLHEEELNRQMSVREENAEEEKEAGR